MPPLKRRKVFDITKPREDTNTFHEFTVYPCQTSLTKQPQTLAPIASFSRSFLPLSWLNCCPSPSRRIPPGSLFYANISCLEKGLHCDQEPIVLGVRLRVPGDDGADGELYVVERMKRGIYSITPLHSWVRTEELLTISRNWHNGDGDSLLNSGAGLRLLQDYSGNDWLERALVTDFVKPDKGKQLNAQLSTTGTVGVHSNRGDQEEVRGDPTKPIVAMDDGSVLDSQASVVPSLSGDTSLSQVPVDANTGGERVTSDVSIDAMQLDLSVMAQDLEGMLDSLRIQYLETLYISKTSVAYFAKGPLSRTRTAFRSNTEGSNLQPVALYNFLNESIMSVKKMDSKYRETLPKMAREISRDVFGLEGTTPQKSRAKRKSKRYKLGKDGMYSDEKDFVSKWCEGTIQTEESPQQAALPDLGRLIGELRLREMQLQILLVLEALALEESPSVKAQVEESKGSKKKKKSKSQELNTTFELLIDRLCIWHTVTFNDILSDSMPYDRGENQQSEKSATNDKLRDFCTEVIIPFYSSRLPDRCQTINRKFGGPALNSPVRKGQSAARPVAENSSRGVDKKTNSQKSRGPLKRVRTDEQIPNTDKRPSFSRSQTAPSIKTTNEPGLGPSDSKSTLSSSLLNDKGRVQKTKRVDNRVVDLDAVAKQHEAKLEKMRLLMDQKKELDAAIQALKKPNREIVSREFADSADKRSSLGGRSRKARNPTRIPPGQSVQVMATPKGSRTKDCSAVGGSSSSLSSLPSHWQRAKVVPEPEEVVDFVQDTPLKSAAQKRGGSGGGGGSVFQGGESNLTSNISPDIILATPQRPRAVLDTIREESQSPLALSKPAPTFARAKQGNTSVWPSTPSSTNQGTPQRENQTSNYNHSTSYSGKDTFIPCTPVRKSKDTTTDTMVADSVLRPARGVGSDPKQSIYDYLGWDASDAYDNDDDDDDELAF